MPSSSNRPIPLPVRIGAALVALLCKVSTLAAQSNDTQMREATPPEAKPPAGKLGFVPVVAPAYQPETSLLIGGAAVLVYQYDEGANRRDSQVSLSGAVSVKGQYTLALQPDIFSWEDRLHIAAMLSAAKFPDVFFGLGSQTRREDQEAYTPIYYIAEGSPALRIVPGLYLGPSFRFQQGRMQSIEPGRLLAGGAVPGSDGGNTVQLGVAGFWDTRDKTLYPRRGTLLNVDARSAHTSWGSDFKFNLLRLDMRQYVSLPWQDHILALEMLVELRDGVPPFYDTGILGGDKMMRGYFAGRFRERQYLAAQAEYRMRLFWRFGAVAFVSTGTVAHDLGQVRVSDVKVAGGAGLRLAPFADIPVNARLDVAYGNDLLLYLNVGEAF